MTILACHCRVAHRVKMLELALNWLAGILAIHTSAKAERLSWAGISDL